MKIGKKLLVGAFLFLSWFTGTFAAVDHFQVTLYPDAAKTGEALDLTIEAVDRNNVVDTSYNWMVLIFSESDAEAELPIVIWDWTYTFKAADQWKILFENGVRFTQAWTQNIYVYDFNDDTVFWYAEVDITAIWDTIDIPIEIISPENWLVIWDNKIKVSGTTDKNHQVKIILNWTWEIITMTNDSGVFEREITNLIEWENSIYAQVLDANSNVAGTSSTIKIKVEKNAVALISARAIPEEVDSESAYEIEVIATPWLREVQALVNDDIVQLTEADAWTYLAKTYAPKEEWIYKIDVILRDDLWREVRELGAASLKVNAVEVVVEPEPEPDEDLNSAEETVEPPVTTPNEPIIKKEKNLKITGLKLVELKSKSILTWDKLEDAESYNVYRIIDMDRNIIEFVQNTKDPIFEVYITWEEIKYEYFAIKAQAKDDDTWESYEWDLSDATKIQTWPEMIILLLVALLLWWLFLFWRQKKAS